MVKIKKCSKFASLIGLEVHAGHGLDYKTTKILRKINSVSCGDDYQILFTASPSKSRIISKISKSLRIKISKIGKICNYSEKSQIINEKNKKIALKYKGYFHKF